MNMNSRAAPARHTRHEPEPETGEETGEETGDICFALTPAQYYLPLPISLIWGRGMWGNTRYRQPLLVQLLCLRENVEFRQGPLGYLRPTFVGRRVCWTGMHQVMNVDIKTVLFL